MVKHWGKSRGWIWDCQRLFLLTEHISSHQSMSFSTLLFPGSRLSFALKQSHTNSDRQIYTSTQQDPEVRLSHCPCTHRVTCQFWLSAPFVACFRSFYFRFVFFSLSGWAHKLMLSLKLSFQCYPLISRHKDLTLLETLEMRVSVGFAVSVAI